MLTGSRKGGESHGSRHIFVAGKYDGTYNAVAVGITRGGFELQQDSKAEMIDESDAYGQTLIDWICRGGDVFLQFESMAYKAGSTSPFWPYGSMGVLGVIARLASDIAVATVLTATASTPAASAPATLTASKSLLAPNSPARLLFHSRLRTVPVRLAVLPYDASGSIKWFTTT